jgi:acyl dehydratase
MSESGVFDGDEDLLKKEIDEVRGLLNRPLRINEWNHEATADTIRHWALGVGDDNPLWLDEDYAASGPYGSLVAPPTFFYSVWGPGCSPGLPRHLNFHGESQWEFMRVVRCGERVTANVKLVDLIEKSSARSGRMLIEVGETVYQTLDGELLAKCISQHLRIPRPDNSGSALYEPRPPHSYSVKELQKIEHEVVTRSRRGARPRSWKDVQIGEELPLLVKGPLDQATMIAFYMGAGSRYQSADLAWKTRYAAETDPASLPNNHPIAWLADRKWIAQGHLETDAAHAVGMPAMYDNAWQRISWMAQAVTDWLGDEGSLKTLSVRIRMPNILGDTLWCGGKVIAKEVKDGEHTATLELFANRQDGALSASGSARVLLKNG